MLETIAVQKWFIRKMLLNSTITKNHEQNLETGINQVKCGFY